MFQKHDKSRRDSSIPGPGTYTVASVFSNNGRDKCFSLKSRGKSMQDLMINKMRDLPGPGQYSPSNTLSKTGRYNISGFRNTSTLAFRPSERFKT